MNKGKGTCEICQRTDVPVRDGRLRSHRKDKADKASQHCSGFGLLAK